MSVFALVKRKFAACIESMGIPKSFIPRSGVDPQFSEYLCKELEKLWFPKFLEFAKEQLEDERNFCGMDEDRWSRLCSSCREWEQVLELVFEDNKTYSRMCGAVQVGGLMCY